MSVTVQTSLSSPKAIECLLQLACEAGVQVPFYQETFATLDFASARLSDLPILTKELVRQAGDKMMRSDYRVAQPGMVEERTSGSTGIPLRILRSRAELVRCAQAFWKARATIYPDVLSTVGAIICPTTPNGGHQPLQLGKQVYLPTLVHSPKDMTAFLDQIDAYQPAWFTSSPNLLAFVAEALRRNNRRLRKKPAFVESAGDYLSPPIRQLLEEVFECPITNTYGCSETYTIAYDCPQGKMHIFDECVVLELLPLNEMEDEYELLVSSLIFEKMPFIRYRIGDSVKRTDIACSCGNPAPVLGEVRGRVGEVIANTTLPGHFFFSLVIRQAVLVCGLEVIRQYQVHQTGPCEFKIQLRLLEASKHEQAEQLQILSATIQEIMQPAFAHQATIIIEQVEYFELTAQGKMQYFICHV